MNMSNIAQKMSCDLKWERKKLRYTTIDWYRNDDVDILHFIFSLFESFCQQATKLFLEGVSAERNGKVYEGIKQFVISVLKIRFYH